LGSKSNLVVYLIRNEQRNDIISVSKKSEAFKINDKQKFSTEKSFEI
jgi:hypothetical protein